MSFGTLLAFIVVIAAFQYQIKLLYESSVLVQNLLQAMNEVQPGVQPDASKPNGNS